jgi:hypothetical protein
MVLELPSNRQLELQSYFIVLKYNEISEMVHEKLIRMRRYFMHTHPHHSSWSTFSMCGETREFRHQAKQDRHITYGEIRCEK